MERVQLNSSTRLTRRGQRGWLTIVGAACFGVVLMMAWLGFASVSVHAQDLQALMTELQQLGEKMAKAPNQAAKCADLPKFRDLLTRIARMEPTLGPAFAQGAEALESDCKDKPVDPHAAPPKPEVASKEAYCLSKYPNPKPLGATTTGAAATGLSFEASCANELATARYEWSKGCLNGDTTDSILDEIAKLDAAGVQARLAYFPVRALDREGSVRDTPWERAEVVWETCLVRTRQRQLSK